MRKLKAGYEGPDAMRAKAEKMADKHLRGMKEPPQSFTAKGNEKTRLYKKGGHSKHHKMSKEQTDMKLPRLAKTPKLNIEKMSKVEHKGFKKGGHKKHFADGGPVGTGFFGGLGNIGSAAMRGSNGIFSGGPTRCWPTSTPDYGQLAGILGNGIGGQPMPPDTSPGIGNSRFTTMPVQRPNMKKGGHAYAKGGAVYEKEMVGEHPSRKPHHNNYEKDMRGEHGHKKRVSKMKSGDAAFAMGGAGKIRHKEMSKSGRAMTKRDDESHHQNRSKKHYAGGGIVGSSLMPNRFGTGVGSGIIPNCWGTGSSNGGIGYAKGGHTFKSAVNSYEKMMRGEHGHMHGTKGHASKRGRCDESHGQMNRKGSGKRSDM